MQETYRPDIASVRQVWSGPAGRPHSCQLQQCVRIDHVVAPLGNARGGPGCGRSRVPRGPRYRRPRLRAGPHALGRPPPTDL